MSARLGDGDGDDDGDDDGARAYGARHVVRALVLLVGAPICAGGAFVAWPLDDALLARRPVSSVVIGDRDGDALREVASAGGRSVPLEDDVVPPPVRAAFIAAEDRRFDEHVGVDVRAVVRALIDAARAGKIVSGASTIPQQLARLLVPRGRTLTGKIGEALWALRLSAHLDKERILVEYLNRVPLGNDVVGVESAARFYFGHPARTLSPAEAALLAGLAHAPAREDPLRHPESALRRRRAILTRMRAVDEDPAFARAIDEPLDLASARRSMRAAHFTTALLRSLPSRGLQDAVSLTTTIDPALQRTAEDIVDEELSGPLADAGVGQAAVVVVDNESGAVLAYVGSRDFFDATREGENDGVRARRQPGSALKPFVYATALSRGMTPATLLADLETSLATDNGSYSPHNYDKRVHGPVRVRAALQNSYNIPAVHTAEILGPARVLDVLRAAGFDTLTDSAAHYGVGIVLGDGDVTLLDMARAYRGLARGGVLEPLVDVTRATDGAGRALPLAAPFAPRRFLPADAVALLTDILVDSQARAPAFGLDNALDLPFPVAAKTGTSRAYVDNWTAGFTHERTVAVWAGNFDGTPMHKIAGITGAGAVFRRVMIAAMRAVARPAPVVDATFAATFERARVCPLSGRLAGPACPGAVDEHFLAGTAPRARCRSHHVDAAGDRALALEPRYLGWARAEGLRAVALPDDASPSARLLSPSDGDEYLREAGVPAGQAVPLRVEGPPGDVEIRIGAQTRTVRAPYAGWIDAALGTTTVALYSRGARVDEATFTVRE